MRRAAVLGLAAMLAVASCSAYPPPGTGGMAEHGALPPDPPGRVDANLADRTSRRLVCLDGAYETLAAGGAALRHPAAMALARAARRDALRWTAAGLAHDGALAADRYAARLAGLAGAAPC